MEGALEVRAKTTLETLPLNDWRVNNPKVVPAGELPLTENWRLGTIVGAQVTEATSTVTLLVDDKPNEPITEHLKVIFPIAVRDWEV